ncbi:MAG: hypothetical protein Nk1A_7260 [Endomicrobiia bacterium]|nr:MAG: hypothetical protein Nk1A_7260 [Endomicrobiia bacterium]
MGDQTQAICERCESIDEVFKRVDGKARLSIDRKGIIFLTDENTAIELEVQSKNNPNKQEVSSLELSMSLIIKSEADIENLKTYLKSDTGKTHIHRTLVLAFQHDNDTKRKLQKTLDDLKWKYAVLNLKNLYGSNYYKSMQEELYIALKIDVTRASIDKTSVEKNLFKFTSEMEISPKPISTGFNNLDKALGCGGLREGRLYAIGAISSLGKTTFALNIADNIASSGEDVLIFSLEMSIKELISKSLSKIMVGIDESPGATQSKTAIEITDKEKWKNDTDPVKLFGKAITKYSEYAKHLHIIEGIGDIGIKKIRDYLNDFQRTGMLPRVAIIDYLQIIYPYSERFTDKQNIDKNITELKRISRDFNMAVIVISSFNRGNYLTEVSFESFKESGSIEYSCDVLMGLQLEIPKTVYEGDEKKVKREISKAINEAKMRYPREVELVILKNRMYKAWEKINFKYYTKYDLFEEVPTKQDSN